MRRFVINYRFILLTSIIAIIGAFTAGALWKISDSSYQVRGKSRAESEKEPSWTNQDAAVVGARAKATFSQGRVAYQGVSFTYDPSLASEIEAELKPAYALQRESDTGEGVAPEHIFFKLEGGRLGEPRSSSVFSAEIMIYPIAAYRRALAKSEAYVRQFDRKILTLKETLATKPRFPDQELPFLPFGIGASQAFRARVKYVSFQNGQGVWFLTQYNQEPALVNNQGLIYTFQGLTYDDVHYVSATFPVTAPMLPDNYDMQSTKDYILVPPKSFRGQEYESFKKRFNSYLRKVTEELESLPSNKYQPDLAMLEDIINSLNVPAK